MVNDLNIIKKTKNKLKSESYVIIKTVRKVFED